MITFIVMRKVALASLLLLFSATAQVPQNEAAAGRGTSDSTLTIKLDTGSQKPASTPLIEYLSAFSEVARAVAWPLLLIVFVITQRDPLCRLFEALIQAVQHSRHIKIGDMIDLEVDRSAKEAEKRETLAKEVTPDEIEAATRVSRMALSSDLSPIRARMLEFAREYEATRSSMKPGPERTRAMNAIVAKMRTLAIAAKPLLREFARDETSPGKRLAALAILQLAPDLAYLDWVVERMGSEQPFLLFHSSLALLAMVRSFGSQYRAKLAEAVARSLQIVRSYSGGPPDQNTIDTLLMAQSELGIEPDI